MVIISLTRCNRNYELGLFEDKRRMNVAITRAKRLCILVGDSVTYKHDEDYEVLFKELFSSLFDVVMMLPTRFIIGCHAPTPRVDWVLVPQAPIDTF